MLSDLRIRLRALVRGDTVEHELDDEMRFHVQHLRDKYVASGLSAADADRRARLEFGGVEQMKEECREARGVALVETTIQDIRYAIRTLRRAPAFSITAVLTVALSTAAVATVFTLWHTLFYRALPVDRPETVVVVAPTRVGMSQLGEMSYPDYLAFRDGTRTLDGLAAHYSSAPLFVTARGNAREINGAVVTANFLPLIGVSPALGRFFTPREDAVRDRDRVVVLGDSLWRSWFAASPDVLGSQLTINGVAFTIIGVTPPAFHGVTTSPVQLYMPMMSLGVGYRWCDDSLAADCTILDLIGRIRTGHTLADVAAELPTLIPTRWTGAKRGENSGVTVFQPRGVTSNDSERRFVEILAAVAAVLLLVCCANLAGLLGAQSAARADEFTIRASLGAAAARLIRQFMTESLVLAIAGGVAGVLLSRVFVGILQVLFYAMDEEGHPQQYDFSLTPEVAIAGLVASLLVGCAFSAIPAWKLARGQRRAHSSRRAYTVNWTAGRWLLGAQAALAVALVAVAAVLAAGATRVVAGSNFDSSHVALMRLRPRLVRYSPERAQRFQRDAIARLAAIPGVESVSMVGQGLVLMGGQVGVTLPGWSADQTLLTSYNEIGPRYFETLRTPVLQGREFDDRDTATSPRVAIVSQALAARLWTDRSAVGSTLLIKGVARDVIGVVADVPLASRVEPLRPFVYVPFWQNPAEVDSRLCIRVAGDPAAMLPQLAREVNRVDPDVPIAEMITLPMQMAGLARPLRLSATFVAYAAVLAMLLTAIGLYGALAFAVSRRRREIGIRLALGASARGVLVMILGQGMIVIGAGVLAGLGVAAAGTRLFSHVLYGTADADWPFYLLSVGIVGSVGALASWLPARRAARVEPTVALRCE
jgi:predicted permease